MKIHNVNALCVFVCHTFMCVSVLCVIVAAWGLQEVRRTDINQASMAALLAAIVGIPFPMNAVVSLSINMVTYSKSTMGGKSDGGTNVLRHQISRGNNCPGFWPTLYSPPSCGCPSHKHVQYTVTKGRILGCGYQNSFDKY